MPPKMSWCFHAPRELLVQSEANSYSTAIENHDFITLDWTDGLDYGLNSGLKLGLNFSNLH